MKQLALISILLLSLTTGGFARNPQFGTLVITTTPDSADVILNDVKEQEITPYTNDKMVLGKHYVTLKPKSPIYKSADYVTEITLDEKKTIDHTFRYRNKSFLNENLSVDKWHLQFESGYSYKNTWGSFESSSVDGNGTELKGDALNFSDSAIVKQYAFPIILRLGLPADMEFHMQLPVAQIGSEVDNAEFGPQDVIMGLKYTHRQYNTAANVQFKFANGDSKERLGTNAYSVALDLITLQSMAGVELLGQVGYEYTFTDIDNNKIDAGDNVRAKLQAGYLLGSVLPYLLANLNYSLADNNITTTKEMQYTTSNGIIVDSVEVTKETEYDMKNDGYAGVLEIGAIVDITPKLAFQAGIPFTILGLNKNKFVGFNFSFAYALDLNSSDDKQTKNVTFKPHFQYDSTAAKHSGSALIFDATEVTNAEYKEFCDRTRTTYPADPGFEDIEDYFRNPEYKDFPVVNVSYADAIRYAEWKDKRLPTATEWKNEFGSMPIEPQNIVSNAQTPQKVTSIDQGNSVFHAIGNVSEWVMEDGVSESASTAFHAGCSYNMPKDRCTNSDRLVDMAGAKGAKFIGFRCVTDLK